VITGRPLGREDLRIRFIACFVLVAAVFGLLAVRLFYLQVFEGKRYRSLSESNRIRVERIPPTRGNIYDRHGDLLAGMSASFEAVLVPAEVEPARSEETYRMAARLLSLDEEEVRRAAELKKPAPWVPRVLKRKLAWEEMARIEARRLDLPGVYVSDAPVRYYPEGNLLSPVLGYLGIVTADELRNPAFAEYDPNDVLGRTGLEKTWEGVLRGMPGGVQMEVDVLGRRLEEVAKLPSLPGRSLVLTIDRGVQQAAERALAGQSGAAVALDIKTGEILALASIPGYDPNLLGAAVSAETWKSLAEDPLHPLLNRAVLGQYAPGSTFKIVMALAGLDSGIVTPSTTIFCPGYFTFAGHTYRCWKKEGHGTVDLDKALAQSCDVYFYELGLKLGVDLIRQYALRFGLGELTGIDLAEEKSGLIPSKEWKRKALKAPWYQGETVPVAIGQGYVTTTPLQLAVMTAAVANPSGTIMRPHLVKRVVDAQGTPEMEAPAEEMGRLDLKPAHLDAVRKALREVVTHGTASRAEIPGFAVAGKTGTAQVIRIKRGEDEDEQATPREYRDHALFVAYAPIEAPRYAVAVIVEHGGHGGTTAVPVAKAILLACREFLEGVPPPAPKGGS